MIHSQREIGIKTVSGHNFNDTRRDDLLEMITAVTSIHLVADVLVIKPIFKTIINKQKFHQYLRITGI